MFDPFLYWNSRTHPNTKSGTGGVGSIEFRELPKLLMDSKKVFELGPGVGRLFPLYKAKDVTTLDLSSTYSTRLNIQALKYNVGLHEFFTDNPSKAFPFDDNSFDLAIAAHVLYHVTFDDINHTIQELYRVSRRIFAIVSNNPTWPPKSNDYPDNLHVFNHNYLQIFEELEIKDVSILSKQGVNTSYLIRK